MGVPVIVMRYVVIKSCFEQKKNYNNISKKTVLTKRPAKGPQKDICLGGWVVFDRPAKEKRQFFFTPVKEGFAILNTNSDIQLYFGCNRSSVHAQERSNAS